MCKNIIVILYFFCLAISSLWTADWYVDNAVAGSNNSGESWANAWTSFAIIQWSSISPGDTIFISGGTVSQTYTEQLNIQASGSNGAPITIRVGQSSPHNGNVIITNDGPGGGILIANRSYITINGNVGGNRRITIQDCTVAGVYVYVSHHIKLSYLYIYHNGDENDSSLDHGIIISSNEYVKPLVEVSYCHIRDNWQDQIAALAASYAPDFGYVLIHHNEISEINDDGFECGMGGVDFYNNIMHGKSFDGGTGHPDGLQFYGEYYRIYNNIFYNLIEANAHMLISPLDALGEERPAKEIYIYNNLIYEDTIATNDGPALRGLVFVPETNTTPSISNIVIANNTIINMPIVGLGARFNDLNVEKIENVIIANNIVHNCYTIGGGTAVNIYGIANDYMINSYAIKTDNPVFLELLTIALGLFLPVSCTYNDDYDNNGNDSILDNSNIIFDNNCISAGNDGSGYIGFNGMFITYDELVETYSINLSGTDLDPSLDAQYKPGDKNSPVCNSGVDLSDYFTFDLHGNNRPNGLWDIGAFEY